MEMLNTIGDSLRNPTSSNHQGDIDDNEDDNEDTKLDKLSEDDKHSWVIGTNSNTVQQLIDSFGKSI